MEKLQNFIDGKFTSPKNGGYFDNYEPGTGKVYSLIPDSDSEDVELAVKAAAVPCIIVQLPPKSQTPASKAGNENGY